MSRPRRAPQKHAGGFLASPVPALAAPRARARDRRSRGEVDVSRHRALARGGDPRVRRFREDGCVAAGTSAGETSDDERIFVDDKHVK